MQETSAKPRIPRLKIGSYSTHDLSVAFLFLLPAFAVFAVFKFYPLLENFSIAMTSWNFFDPKRYVGFDNYIRLFRSSTFWKVLGNTFHYTFWSTLLSLLIGLTLALLFSRRKGTSVRIFQTLFFIPNITTTSAVAILWIWVFNPSNGLMEIIYSLFNAKSPDWLLNAKYARWAIISLGVWRAMGYNMMIFSSGIAQISEDVYEAARIDGASKFRQAVNITIPLLWPTIVFLGTTTFITSMQVFDSVQVMTSGNNGTSVINLYIYTEAFVKNHAGRAAAASVILFIILLVCTIFQRFLTEERKPKND